MTLSEEAGGRRVRPTTAHEQNKTTMPTKQYRLTLNRIEVLRMRQTRNINTISRRRSRSGFTCVQTADESRSAHNARLLAAYTCATKDATPFGQIARLAIDAQLSKPTDACVRWRVLVLPGVDRVLAATDGRASAVHALSGNRRALS